MRTTIRLDDKLLTEAKELAARSRRTLTAVIEDALREMLARQRGQKDRKSVRLKTVDGNGPQVGVDLDNTAELWDLMETGDDAH